MPTFSQDDVTLHYEVQGEGFPLLLIAPGGMHSAAAVWDRMPYNPAQELANVFQVVTMDQRNAGGSTAPVTAADGWQTYTADQLALMDHLGLERFHVAGMCIGGPYCMGLIQAAPERVASAVLMQTIGLDDNRQAFYDMFDAWADSLRAQRPEVPGAAWQSFRENMYGGDFLFNVDRDFVRRCRTPLLVLCGHDLYHPESTSREIAELAPDARFIEQWKEGDDLVAVRTAVREFLLANTPR